MKAPSPMPPSNAGERDSGHARAAKRLSSLAANLLATGLILVAGLALGRQVLQWWQVDRASLLNSVPVSGPPLGDLGDPASPHLFEIGELPFALRLASLVGNTQTAFAALRELGADAVARPGDFLGPPGPAEARMLSRISRLEPAAQDKGRWELYGLDGPLLLVAGVQLSSSPSAITRTPESLGRRVVFWGFAIPAAAAKSADEWQWTLLSYHAGSGNDSRGIAANEFPLPEGARRTLSLAAEDGSRLIGFRSLRDSGGWRQFFEKRLEADGWKLSSAWRGESAAWHGHFEKQGLAAEISWTPASDGESSGLIVISPRPEFKP